MKKYPVIIIGGGLAGLTAALTLAQNGIETLLIEKQQYPFHRVCGEYISNEVLGILAGLGFNPFDWGAQAITRSVITAPKGNAAQATLPLGAFSISRYTMDYQLYRLAQAAGVCFKLETSATDIRFTGDSFEIDTSSGIVFAADIVIGAFGKRSLLDRKLDRPFFQKRSPYMAVKTHRKGDFPKDLVALHNFEAGYCGVSCVEEGRINACYLVQRDRFKEYKSTDELERQVLRQNPHLDRIFSETTSLFDKPLVINEISFAPKETVHRHILMAGDAAGLVTPLNGNGMAMAIHGASMLSYLIKDYFEGNIRREALEMRYTQQWKRTFAARLRWGRWIQYSFQHGMFSNAAISLLATFPGVLQSIIRKTHGKPA